jgi:hypothetical protein
MMKILNREGLLENAKYSNTMDSEKNLVKGRPDYTGEMIGHWSAISEMWNDLEMLVKTGSDIMTPHFPEGTNVDEMI